MLLYLNNCCCVGTRRRCLFRLELRHENDKNRALASVRATAGKSGYLWPPLSLIRLPLCLPPGPRDFPLQKCAFADANHDSRLAIRCLSFACLLWGPNLDFCKEYGTKLPNCCITMVSFTHFWLQNTIVGCDLAGSPWVVLCPCGLKFGL